MLRKLKWGHVHKYEIVLQTLDIIEKNNVLLENDKFMTKGVEIFWTRVF